MSPQVFLSYSHDSPAHKRWVAELATFLRENGVDAVLDQWDLSPGDDVTKFMEDGLRSADRVLVICTDEYLRKAEGGTGGVAYERMIVTAELVRGLGTKKFVPIVRSVLGADKLPEFLGARLWIDLSTDNADEALERQRLLKELHNVSHLEKPPLGPNPFERNSTAVAKVGVADSASAVSGNDPESLYRLAIQLAGAGDLMGWRQAAKKVGAASEAALGAWRTTYEGHSPKDFPNLLGAVDEAVHAVAPLLVLALAGVESRHPSLVDQRAALDDILNFGGWPHSHRQILADLPWTLGYVYHGLHGAMAIATDQLDVALAFADMQVRNPISGDTGPLTSHSRLVGWPPSLGGSCTQAWQYLETASDRWQWLSPMFGSPRAYTESVTSYYLLLTLDEFARTTATPQGRALLQNPQLANLDVPIAFADSDPDLIDTAVRRVRRLLPLLRARWTAKQLPVDNFPALWKGWMTLSTAWLRNVHPNRAMRVPYSHLMWLEGE